MKIFKLFLLLISVFGTLSSNAQTAKRIFADAEKQTTFMLDQVPLAKAEWLKDVKNAKKPVVVSPRSLSPDGKLNLVAAKDWTSGFFPGVLWLLYEQTGDKKWESQAREFTANIENEKMNGGTHDMGFKIYNSFGQGYRLTNDPGYKEIIIQGAKTLCRRFNPIVGCIRSWDGYHRQHVEFRIVVCSNQDDG
jgi:unsaturated chondroitin disaccharide hydrolase